MDGDYNEPLIGANIVMNTGIGASTNLDGEYTLQLNQVRILLISNM